MGTFVVDTGATSHMTSQVSLLDDVVLYKGTVTVAGGRIVTSTGKGNMRVTAVDINGDGVLITLLDVLIVPELERSLLSIPKLLTKGGSAVFKGGSGSYFQIGKLVLPIERVNGLCLWKCEPHGSSASPEDVTRAVAFTAEVKNATLWHGRFGHVSLLNFKKVSGPNVEIPEDLGGDSNCQVCPLSKQTHISFPKEAVRAATEPFDTLHVDLLGPMDEVSFGGSRYAAVCVDECTRYVMVKPMELKSDFLATFQATMNEVRALGFQVRNLRTDYGGEFTSKTLKDFCQANSVLHTFAGPYAPQQRWELLKE